jgi:type VI secretion system protein ImpA
MTDAALIELDRLIHPISPDRPAGEDISFSAVYDEIRAARTGDDASLAAGVWERELKIADWPRVQALATAALAEQSKDLQVACWLAEALCQIHGFAGARDGLVLLTELLRQHWEHLYPENAGDLEPRANCLTWMSGVLARQIRRQALTSEGRGWYDYQNALQVDNAGERDRTLMAELMAEGKINGETWRKQVAATPSESFARAQEDLLGCQEACEALDAAIDEVFGNEGPSLRDLRTAIQDVLSLVGAIAKERGITAPAPAAEAAAAAAPSITDGTSPAETPAAAGATPAPAAGAAPVARRAQSRDDALRQLREIAEFFRRSEPHSPVAYLVERAVKWADMPLDLWLQEVVKDQGVLTMLNETLGVEPRDGGIA